MGGDHLMGLSQYIKDAVKKHLKDKYPPDYQFTEVESGKSSDRPEHLQKL